MASKVATMVGKKMLGSEFKKYSGKKVAGDYDPLFEMRPDNRGKMKKHKKLIPAYIPEQDALILAKVRKRAYRLDMALFNFMGIRFGWSSVIGLVPEIGDVVDLVMAMSLFRQCCKVKGGLDSSVKMKMLFWIFIDFIIGLVPIAGDLLDASIKANTQNCRLLEQHLDRKYKDEETKKAEREYRRTSGTNYKALAPATVYEEYDERDRDFNTPPPGYDNDIYHEPSRPSRAHSGRGRQEDVEMAPARQSDRPSDRTTSKKKKSGWGRG
ncbi:hypothetical protein BT63DRAFT_316225 [Microthyrium microscopicum]|uniref:PH domain-containing protein n=1 Tax=Microthyrium microscopicum TaxID=703497 RepID=A0A6A6U5J0_9PEZI|nr:hypothetical protein BT63DRAFT_316225 [Microthyrium microscopicum]